MKKLIRYGANPMGQNASRQTDFTYKLLRGFVSGARFYLYNTGKIPLQPLLNNLRECLLSRESVPYDSMYPLCLLPVVPSGVPYRNIIDKKLVDAMFDGQFFPSSFEAFSFRLEDGISVWSYLRFRMGDALSVSPAHFVAYLACKIGRAHV